MKNIFFCKTCGNYYYNDSIGNELFYCQLEDIDEITLDTCDYKLLKDCQCNECMNIYIL